jgi:hypothetical protein
MENWGMSNEHDILCCVDLQYGISLFRKCTTCNLQSENTSWTSNQQAVSLAAYMFAYTAYFSTLKMAEVNST